MSELVRLRGKIYFTKYILCSGRLRGYDGSLLFSTDFSSLHHSSVVECVPDVIPYCLSQQRIATTPNWKPLPSHPVMLVMKMMRKSMLYFIYKKIEGFTRMVWWCCQWWYKAIESSSPWSHLTTPRSKINLSRHRPHLRFNFSFFVNFSHSELSKNGKGHVSDIQC